MNPDPLYPATTRAKRILREALGICSVCGLPALVRITGIGRLCCGCVDAIKEASHV